MLGRVPGMDTIESPLADHARREEDAVAVVREGRVDSRDRLDSKINLSG